MIPRVLVVDDEALIRWSLREAFSAAGFQVTEAADAHTALLKLTEPQQRVHAVLLDLRLPDSRDLTLLAGMKALRPDLPVILMTAYGTPETAADALRLGACRVVPKPFDVEQMVRLVREALNGGVARA